METIQMVQKAAAMGTGDWQLHHDNTPNSCITSRAEFLVKHQITQVTQHPYSPDLVPWDFWLFPKLKSPLKGKRFQTIEESQENTKGQLMVIGRPVWGPKVPTLKGTEVSLSCVQCFLYLVSSSINIYFSHDWVPSGQTSYICCYEKVNQGKEPASEGKAVQDRMLRSGVSKRPFEGRPDWI